MQLALLGSGERLAAFQYLVLFLIVCVSAAATLHVPINKAAWAIVIFCCGLAVALAIRSIKSATNRNLLLGGIAATLAVLGAVVVMLWGSLIKDEFVSVFPDPWAYCEHRRKNRINPPGSKSDANPVFALGPMGARHVIRQYTEENRTR